MTVLQSLTRTLRTVLREPSLFAPAAVYALLALPAVVLPLLSVPLVGSLGSLLLVALAPLFVGGLVGMAGEALDGRASLGTFTAEGTDNYATLLLATVLQFAAVFVAFVVFGVVAVVLLALAVVLVPDAGAAMGVGVSVAVLGFVALSFLVGFFVQFFFQFHSIAIVVEDAGVVDGFKRSYRFVRSNLLSAFGYTLLAFALSMVVQLPTLALSLVDPLTAYGVIVEPSAAVLGALVGLAFLSMMLFFAFQQTFATAFFLDARGTGDASDARTVRP